VATPSRQFGMVWYNPQREPQGILGPVPFYEYGTMLRIVELQVLEDGRSIVETIGVSRFRVQEHGILDGYAIGKVEQFDDEEAAGEQGDEDTVMSVEPTTTTHVPSPSPSLFGRNLCHFNPANASHLRALNALSQQELMTICTKFVERMKSASATWLHKSVVESYGECPDDPARFPWWFASVIPTSEAEKYKMLQTRSVSDRMRMCVVFAAELEQQMWYDCNSYSSYITPSFER